MSLSEMALRNSKAKAKQYKLHDGFGLFVIIRPTGAKLWRFQYRFSGKEQQLSIGTYPETSLKAERLRRDEARRFLADGIDPAAHKKQEVVARMIAASNKFKVIAEEFIAKREQDGMSNATMIKMRWFAALIERDIGNRPMSGIEPFELLTAIKKIERAGNHETAKRVQAVVTTAPAATNTPVARSVPASILKTPLHPHTRPHHRPKPQKKAREDFPYVDGVPASARHNQARTH